MRPSQIISWQRFKDQLSSTTLANLKSIIFLTTVVFISAFFILNWFFINTLKNQYKEVTDKEARLYAVAISENLHISELNWVFAEVLQKSKIPIIITNKYNLPLNWKNIKPGIFSSARKVFSESINYYQLSKQEQDFLKKELERLDKKNPPLKLISEGNVLGHLHYGEIELINFLGWMPLLEFAVLCLVIFFGYYGYNVLRSGERNLLWAALAKETAHQMGTPLSSLMGWMEFLKQRVQKIPSNTGFLDIINEMDGDISRLTKVSIRFSQIGSLPKLKEQSVNDLVKTTAGYFSQRLPQLSKKVDIKLKLAELPDIWINHELLGWVLENLVKNALDSIKGKSGNITIETFYAKADKTIHLITTDNGSGIEKENWKRIFQTGFSTKKRGWGLGLSLARRIITIYHEGTIFVEWSSKYHGTRIRIILPLIPQRIKKELNGKWKKTNPMGG